ncbi:hypothetical protein GDO78_009400 [Eleutherodactylus coqui]|uniref:Uncharacterized protein n=1 Tax=Eleutherodactylus coqui TaxID=57060 RepID=A0A8J6F8F0_ELECQ|nr:hypothetical protein GDO78_009400 [Eleutherodactylus coqui]
MGNIVYHGGWRGMLGLAVLAGRLWGYHGHYNTPWRLAGHADSSSNGARQKMLCLVVPPQRVVLRLWWHSKHYGIIREAGRACWLFQY